MANTEKQRHCETLLKELSVDFTTKLEDGKDYLPNQRLEVYSGNIKVGEYGNLENGYYYYEFGVQKLIDSKKVERKYKEISKYPPQVEDLTLQLPEKTFIGDVIEHVYSISNIVYRVELTDIFEANYTFNIQYLDENKTLTDKEVEEIRTKILSSLKSKFGITIKE
jgi:phenylalanyl-tRNA synthetase beta chain